MSSEKTKSAVLEMNDVSVASAFSPENAVIESVTWRVNPGECWVIGGLHGSGKTDLILTSAGLQKPLSGSLHLFGKDQWSLDEHDLVESRRRIGVVFENGGRMFRQLTVAENVALPIRYHQNATMSDAEQRVEKLLELTGLTPFRRNSIGTLSPPWQQRVGLARALALEPELLLIDKPFVGARYLLWWQECFRKLLRGDFYLQRPITIAMTTDDFRDWSKVGTHFAMVKKKRWHALEPTAELGSFQEELWRDLTNEIPS